MLQASMFDGLALDGFALFDDGWRPAEVGISGCHVLQALVIALVVVMVDEGLDLAFKVAGQEIVLQQNAVFQGLVLALDLTLGLGGHRGTPSAQPVAVDEDDPAQHPTVINPGLAVALGKIGRQTHHLLVC